MDGAIHRRGGPQIMDETRRLYPKGCPSGSAVISSAGNLAARYVIHAVGPVYRDGQSGEGALLASAYHRSLELALEHGCRSVAFPALSAGVYGYPLPEAAQIAVETAGESLLCNGNPKLVRFVLFGETAYQAFQTALANFARGRDGFDEPPSRD